MDFGLPKSRSKKEIKEPPAPPAPKRVPDDPQFEYLEIDCDASLGYPILQGQELEVFIEYHCDLPLKNLKSTFRIDFSNSNPSSFDVLASFVGPKLKMIDCPEVNFNVVKSFSTASQSFMLQNYSEVDAEVIIKCAKHTVLDMESKMP